MDVEKDYDIHLETMAVLPYYDRFANLQTIVLEEHNHFLVEIPPKKVVDDSCRYYGASYQGRLEGVKRVMGISKKAPIAISPGLGIFFFPLESPSNASCVWLSHSHIKEVTENNDREAVILFTNDQSLVLPYSRKQIETKILRTAQYRHLLLSRTTYPKSSLIYERRTDELQLIRDPNKQTYEVKE